MTSETKIRQPIVTVAGHVDHGKTSILDCFRGSCVQEGEAGGITQKISFTKYPLGKIKESCPLIEKSGVNLEIPGFLFIDTPGHAAFTNLRKRGGSLADLAIVVVSIKEGIKPQTAEVFNILRANKTPFLIALNKVDTISGWRNSKQGIKNSIESQPINVAEEYQEALLTFQGSLQEHGFDSALFYEITDFTKQIALVPCSARTKEGISELLFVLCGLCQRFLKERLKVKEEAKGVILEIKKDKTQESVEAILYDGDLRVGEEIAIASFGEPIVSKIRALEEIMPLSFKYKSTDFASAATGVRIHLTNKEGILPGMLFQEVKGNLEQIKANFKKEIQESIKLDKQGIIIKADSLGSLEALMTLLRQDNIPVLKAGIGPIGKTDIISAKASLEINELDAIVLGFNVEKEEELESSNVKIITNQVVYKLIDDLKLWREERAKQIEREKMMALAPIVKLEILHNYVFRNSNPAIFGVRVLAGKAKMGMNLINENGEEIGRLKGIQLDKVSVNEVEAGKEVAISIPGTAFDRHIKDSKYLYSFLSERQIKEFKKNKELLSSGELQAIQEVIRIRKLEL